jgi:hypothetical protein
VDGSTQSAINFLGREAVRKGSDPAAATKDSSTSQDAGDVEGTGGQKAVAVLNGIQ